MSLQQVFMERMERSIKSEDYLGGLNGERFLQATLKGEIVASLALFRHVTRCKELNSEHFLLI